MASPQVAPTIGVDVGGTYVKGVVTDREGSIVARVRRPSGRAAGPDAVLAATLATLDAAIDATPGALAPAAIGVAVPGIVDDGGVVRWAANLGWRDLPIRALIANHTSLPLWVGQDVYAGGAAEFRRGAARGARTAAFIPVGTGISAALLVDGRPHRADGYAGEIGHLDTGHGELCGCGKRGCLEAIASAAAVARRYAVRAGTPTEGSAGVVAQLRAGDEVARSVWQEAVQALAFALSWVVGVLAPEVIVIGGGLALAGDLLFDPLRAEIGRRLTYHRVSLVVPARFGDAAGSVGASLLAAQSESSSGS